MNHIAKAVIKRKLHQRLRELANVERPAADSVAGAADVSFEFFPPATVAMEHTLWQTIDSLAVFDPQFVSITYGAGGSGRERSFTAVRNILARTTLPVAAHLCCIANARVAVDEAVREFHAAGVRHIVALRGDMPKDRNSPSPADSYRYAADLVAAIRRVAEMEISVAAYPEVHPEARSAADDLDNLKRKIDAGATRAITQFFFDTDTYFRFVERARKAGIDVPIVPGIMPIANFANTARFAQRCGASIPDWLGERFAGLDDDSELRQLAATVVAGEQCLRLRQQGVDAFHFYTLNSAGLSHAICRLCGIGAVGREQRRLLVQ